MSKRYRFSVKKEVGHVKKLSDTIYAEDLKDACNKFADNISTSILDNESTYSYYSKRVEECVGENKNHVLLKFDYKNEQVETFIERID